MRLMDDLAEMLEKELKNIVKQDSITPQSLEVVDKAVDIIKDIETIKAMRGEFGSEYSNRGYYDYIGDDGYSMARDRYGRYASRDYSSNMMHSNRRYSRHDETEAMIAKLESMSEVTDDPRIRRAIDQCITKLEG